MTARIAIDFGTARTKLAYLPGTGLQPELLRFFDDDAERSYLPSLFYLPKDDKPPLIGFEAEAMLQEDPAGVIDDLKRRLREPRRRANGRDAAPEDLLTMLFADLRARAGKQIAAFREAAPAVVVLTVPATFGPAQRDLVKRAALGAGFTQVADIIEEPIAAARGWLSTNQEVADRVVVLDCGAGTVDWTYLRQRKDRTFDVVPSCPPAGIERLGGHDIDEALVDLLERKLADLGGESLEFAASRRARLRGRMRRLKERLRRDDEREFTVRVGDQAIAVTREEAEGVIRDHFTSAAADGFASYLRQIASAEPGTTPPPVLLVGGASSLPGLRQAIEAIGSTVFEWDRGDFAAAVGALVDLQAKSAQSGSGPSSDESDPSANADGPTASEVEDDSLEIVSREARLALVRGDPALALLKGLAWWHRSRALGIEPPEKLYKLLRDAASSDGLIVEAKAVYPFAFMLPNNDVFVLQSTKVVQTCLAEDLVNVKLWYKDGVLAPLTDKLMALLIRSRIDVYRFDADEPAFSFNVNGSDLRTIALSPDSRRCLVGNTDQSIRQHDCISGAQIGGDIVLSAAPADIVVPAFTDAREGAILAAWHVKSGDTVGLGQRIASLKSGELVTDVFAPTLGIVEFKETMIGDAVKPEQVIGTMEVDTKSEFSKRAIVRSVGISNNGRILLVGYADGQIAQFHASDGEREGETFQHRPGLKSAGYSPSYDYVVALTVDNRVLLLNRRLRLLANCDHMAQINGHEFSRDGKLLLTFDNVGNARVFRLADGLQLRCRVRPTGGSINSACFSPDGTAVATASDDGRVRFWNSENGESLGVQITHDQPVKFARFISGGKRLFTHSNGILRVWDVSHLFSNGEALVRHLCRGREKENRKFTDLELRTSLVRDLPGDPVTACLELFPADPVDLERKREVYAKLEALILDRLDVDAKAVHLDAHFMSDLGADSLDLVELTMAFEEAFGLPLSDDDAERLATVGAALDYVLERQA